MNSYYDNVYNTYQYQYHYEYQQAMEQQYYLQLYYQQESQVPCTPYPQPAKSNTFQRPRSDSSSSSNSNSSTPLNDRSPFNTEYGMPLSEIYTHYKDLEKKWKSWFNPTGKNISVNEIPEYFIQHAKNVGSIPKNILIAVQEALLCRQLNRVHYEITNGTKCEGHAYFIDMLQKLESMIKTEFPSDYTPYTNGDGLVELAQQVYNRKNEDKK